LRAPERAAKSPANNGPGFVSQFFSSSMGPLPKRAVVLAKCYIRRLSSKADCTNFQVSAVCAEPACS
jgi:hypothetical protein